MWVTNQSKSWIIGKNNTAVFNADRVQTKITHEGACDLKSRLLRDQGILVLRYVVTYSKHRTQNMTQSHPKL